MSSSFKETILKLLAVTNYPVDGLTEDDINSFENLPHLKPMFEWFTQNVSEANCVTPEDLEQFKKLEETGKVKEGRELEKALESYSTKAGGAAVPFDESLIDPHQELELLKEQLHYKKVLHQEVCSSNVAMDDDIRQLKKYQQRAEADQKEVIKNICATTNSLKGNISGFQEDLNELGDDITGLAQGNMSAEASTDEGIHSLTSSTSSAVIDNASTSSWQTVPEKDSDRKYLCQLSLEKYQQIHKKFLKRLTKLLEAFSKIGKSNGNKVVETEFLMIKERLEKQMHIRIEKEAELEGIRAERVKIKDLHKKLLTEGSIIPTLQREKKGITDKTAEGSLNLSVGEDLTMACQQWAEWKTLLAVELKLKERIEFSKQLIKKMDELLKPVLLKLNADKILHEVLRHEKEKIELSIKLYKSHHSSLQHQYDQMKKRIKTMQNNLRDCEQFYSLPLEKRNKLVEELASIMLCDNKGVYQAVQHLSESSQREHQANYQHYVREKNNLIITEESVKELCKMDKFQSVINETDAKRVIDNIQKGLDQIDSGIVEVNIGIKEVIQTISDEAEENKEEDNDEI